MSTGKPPNIEMLKAVRDLKGLADALSYTERKDIPIEAAHAIGELGDPGVLTALITALKAALKAELFDLGEKGLSEAIAGALVKIGAPSVEPLCAALNDDDFILRKAAAEALGQICDPRGVEPLIAALKDSTLDVDIFAAAALGQIGDPQAVDPLINTLGGERSLLRNFAAEALGKIGDARAVGPLIALLKDGKWDVRRAAAEALGKLGDPRAVKPLIAAQKDKMAEVREAAIEALGSLGRQPERDRKKTVLSNLFRKKATGDTVVPGQKSMGTLVAKACSPNELEREQAKQELVEIGKPAVHEIINALKSERTAQGRLLPGQHLWLAEVLSDIGITAVDQMLNELRHIKGSANEWTLSHGFAMAFDNVKDPSASRLLAMSSGDFSPLVNISLTSALRNIEIHNSGTMEKMLQDPDSRVRKQAAFVLGSLSDASAKQALEKLLADNDSGVREIAAAALEKIAHGA